MLTTNDRAPSEDFEAEGISTRLQSLSQLYAMMAAAGAAILRADTPTEVYDALCRVVTDLGGFHIVWIGEVHPDGAIVPVARAGTPPPLATTLHRDRTHRPMLATMALTENRAVVVADIEADHASHSWGSDLDRHYRARSGCAIPLRCGAEIVAVFSTYMAEVDAYSEERVQLLERLADDVSFALQAIADRQAQSEAHGARAQAEAELAARAEMHAELARIGQSAFSTSDLDDLFADIVHTAHRVLRADGAAIEERSGDDGLVLRVAAGKAVRWPASRRMPGAGSFAHRLLAHDGPLVIPDLDHDRSVTVRPDPEVRAIAGVALRRPDRTHGALVVLAREPRHFAADEVDFLQSLANIAVAALDHADASQRLLEQALHDPLTGLPNRTLLYERIEQAAATLAPGRALAVLLVDLDGFKLVNDAFGHDLGDQLLMAVAERLTAGARRGDTVARLGGDEFAVLCDDIGGLDDAIAIAERLGASIVDPFELEMVDTYVTASIGITLHRGDGRSPRGLLREADAAMYVAKENGRACYEIYDDTMRRRVLRRLQMTNDLRRAIDSDELELVWHPVLPVEPPPPGDHPTVCLEALLRWNHPTMGQLRPDRFIEIAEETGLIIPLGEWVLRAAGEQLRQWRLGDQAGCPDYVSINLSAHQLARPTIVDAIVAAFAASGIEPGAVVLEITETVLMVEPERSVARLSELRELGFILSLDDFGTGYSSLSYLRDLPVHGLKIDRSFIGRLGSGGSDDDIVEAIIRLAHAVGIMVVAEGVETCDQLHALRAMGCDRAQGFLWTRPLPALAVPPWVARHRADPSVREQVAPPVLAS